MTRYTTFALASVLALSAAPAFAQDISAGGDLKSSYTLDDGIVATDGPVAQGWVSVDLGSGFSVEAWGSKGLDSNIGDEVDLTLTYERELESGFTIKASASRYLLFGDVPDMTTLEVGLSHGPVDVTVTQYLWEGGLPDATQFQLGYNAELAPKLSGRLEVTYETGFDLRDTVLVGADVRYALSDRFSVFATGYLPVRESGANGPKLVAGVSFNF